MPISDAVKKWKSPKAPLTKVNTVEEDVGGTDSLAYSNPILSHTTSNPFKIDDSDIELINSTTDETGFKRWCTQTYALYKKSMKLLFRRFKYLVLRALLIPVLFTLYMGYSKYIYYPIEHYGVANSNQPIQSLADAVGDQLLLPYYIASNSSKTANTGGASRVDVDSMHNIMNKVLAGLGSSQVRHLSDPDTLLQICAQTLRGTSKCYGGVQWNDLNPKTGLYNYTIRGNAGLGNVDVTSTKTDIDRYVLPLQLALDNAIRSSFSSEASGSSVLSIPYTSISDEQNKLNRDQRFSDTMKKWLAPAMYISLIGVVYHLSGTVAQDRELGLTNLLFSMQTSTYARLAGYMSAFSTVYFPSWIIVGIIFARAYFKHSNAAICIFMALFNGFASVSWSILLGTIMPNAQLAGISAAGFSVVLAILTSVQTQVGGGADQPAAIYICSLLFNPMSFCMFFQLLCQSERDYSPLDLVGKHGGNTYPIVVFLAPFFQIVLYLALTVVLEKLIGGRHSAPKTFGDESVAVQITGLSKEFKPWSLFKSEKKKQEKTVRAVSDLSLSITSHQIFSLLGANGSGKTTTLEMVAGIQHPSSGNILFGQGTKLGICPQKNVLWDNLTVREHLQMWSRIKGVPKQNVDAVTSFFIKKCGLEKKTNTLSKNLSGGQKRKLQLAIMFTGGSNVCCIDEVSSGLDPVSRRMIWDILLAFRSTHTMILTTHFLDEADLLSDNIAILSKGVLQAQGTPIDLKQKLGQGYRVFIDELGTGKEQIHLFETPREALEFAKPLESQNVSYRIVGPELEDVFLKLASKDHEGEISLDQEHEIVAIEPLSEADMEKGTKEVSRRQVGFFAQLIALLRKRYIIFRRAPIAEIAFFAIPLIVVGACSTFLKSTEKTIDCSIASRFSRQKYPLLPLDIITKVPIANRELFARSLNGYNAFVRGQASWASLYQPFESSLAIMNQTFASAAEFVPSFDDFYNFLKVNYSTTEPGGISLVSDRYAVGYQADGIGSAPYGLFLLNLLTNMISNGTPQIVANFSPFQLAWVSGTGNSLQFVTYVGLGFAVAPAFAGLYPTYERLSKVRAMQYCNGLFVLPLWTSHFLFNLFLSIIVSAIVVGIVNSSITGLYGPGYLFITLVLYFSASVLFAFIVSLFVKSQLAAFAVVAAYQAVMVLVYLVGYLATQTFGDPNKIESQTRIIFFTIAVISPAQSLMQALFVTFNMFGILCGFGTQIQYMGDIRAFGGPILYLIVQSVLMFLFLVLWDSGKFEKLRFRNRKKSKSNSSSDDTPDPIIGQANELQIRDDIADGLVVNDVSKKYGDQTVVSHVSFDVKSGDCFALLGPNGAGKTTMFNLIRGQTSITAGSIHVMGISVNKNKNSARAQLGVCPQFDAMDKMSVSETLLFYSRLRGINKSQMKDHVARLLKAVGLTQFRGRMAHQLSGGNKRKLSLAVSLVGDPPVVLLDEPSSGMDALAKRVMWRAVASVTQDDRRAMLLTTHSMEEADALANTAGFLAKKMLVTGTCRELTATCGGAVCHVHLVCESAPNSTKQEMHMVVQKMKGLFGSEVQVEDRMYQGQIKMVVPTTSNDEKYEGQSNEVQPLSHIFQTLEENKDQLAIRSYSVFPTRLEQVFLNIVGTHIENED